MLLTALAIDAGPDRSGVVSVAFDGAAFELLYWKHLLFRGGVFVAGVHEPLLGGTELDLLLEDVADTGGLVVLETVRGFAYELARVPYLVETARIEGRIIEKACAHKIEPWLLTAKEARGELCRSQGVGDGPVEAMVRGLVRNFPERVTREQVAHICDGGAQAIVALCRAARKPIPRTPALEMALVRATAKEKQDREAKAARRAAGDMAPSKTRPTRAMKARRRAGAAKGWATRRGGA